jgi:predicted adenine nucleotide alpha hydrolase (AANH) superfamily ATPase
VDVINKIGETVSEKSGIKYYAADLKKKDGFKKANEISREYGFYRQKYCGCVYSNKAD